MSTDIRTQIESANRGFMAAFKEGNATAIANLYTPSAKLLPANSDFVSGTDSIQQFWQGVFGLGIKEVKLETIEVEDHRDTAFEVGRYQLLAAGDKVADVGKYLVVWKNDNGVWKLHRDIWTTSQQAAAAA